MTTAAIIREISRLPWHEKLLVMEKTIEALRHTPRMTMEQAADELYQDYCTDPELTAFTSLDQADFYEAR